MNITKMKENSALTILLEGRLDTATAPMLESVITGELSDVTDLCFDLQNLEYISSAGLRLLLTAQKIMNKQGQMTVKNANDAIKEIFEITGFSDILTVA